ncbi:MAG: tryptophan 7-halogenase, partial [Acidobacteria bacterium]|nr:tryptophan 7-halogenase [Acidobacteriota bacterium]
MPKPVLLTVDDDPEVLRAIERDLRGHYAQNYRVMRADSGDAGLATLRELKARNNPVALVLADQRMPHMDGVGFLAEAMDIHPQAKRALLTAYADTNAAIDAINEARIHYYLMKPWDPPEEKLFPAIDDLLHDWSSQFRPPYEGIRVLGTRWSSRSYELRDFLARNQVPYQWIDVEVAASDADVRRLCESLGPEAENLPLILFPDGQRIAEPTQQVVADKIGLRTHAQTNFYDLAIVGGGPAGSTVASLLKKYQPELKVAIFEREKFPREHIGESQLPAISPILNELGAWDKVEAANFPIKVGATYRWGNTKGLWKFDFLLHPFEDEPRPGKYNQQRESTAFQVDRSV